MNVDLSGYDNLVRFTERMLTDSTVQKLMTEEGLDQH